MLLTDVKIKNAKPAVKAYKLYDERGLFLIVTPAVGKWWRFKYRFDDKEKLLSLGVYPDIGLRDARDRRDEARKLVAHFIDPGLQRKAQKTVRQEHAANSFEIVAREWHAKYMPTWVEHHGDRILRRLERDVFPWIGNKPVVEISCATVAKRRLLAVFSQPSLCTIAKNEPAGHSSSRICVNSISSANSKKGVSPEISRVS